MSAPLAEKFWRIAAQDGTEPTASDIMIFSALGDPFSDDTVWAKKFTEELWGLPKSVKRLNLHINSPGGSVAEAQAIYSALADHPSEKVVYVDGIAASAATIPMMAGHKVYIRSNANMMIHLPMALAVGNADDMRDAISMLESVTESIINVYQKKTHQPREMIRDLMAAETWFTPDQAVEYGFADEVRGVIKAAASLNGGSVMFNDRFFDLKPFNYKNVPAFPEASMKKTITDAASAPAPPPKTQPKPKEEPVQEPLPVEPEPERDVEEEIKSIWKDYPRAAGAIRDKATGDERKRLADLDGFLALSEKLPNACAELVAAAKADGRTLEAIGLELACAQAKDGRHRDADVLNGVTAGDAPFAGVRPAAGKAVPAKDRSALANLIVNAGKDGKKITTEFELVKKKRN